MNSFFGQHKSSVRFLLVFALLSWVSLGYAVVKNVSVVGGDGQPIASQTVTIVFPDGSKQTAETDDRGILIFDFPNNGNYSIIYPGGQMTLSVTGATVAVTSGTGAVVGGGAAGGSAMTGALMAAGAFAAAGLVVNNADNNSVPSSGGGVSGAYNVTGSTVNFNPGSHPDRFSTATYTVTQNGNNITVQISGTGINATISGTVDPDGTFSASGTGDYEGNNTQIQLSGQFDETNGTFNAQASAGTDGNLPGGQPIVVSLDAQR